MSGSEFYQLFSYREYRPNYALHLLLFVVTFLTVAIAGVQWILKDPYELSNLHLGLPYALSILFIIASHEFGHYFAAKRHGVVTTLPFFIPFPPIPFVLNFGTLGAIIRIKSVVPNKKALFDIGVAGPISGFIATLLVLIYGFLNLPSVEYLYQIHPEYRFLPTLPKGDLTFGDTLLFLIFKKFFSLINPEAFIPPMNEIYHYPYLCAGWFGLLVTAMNLIPIGQLDGGHIIFAMFGENHKYIARGFFYSLVVLGLFGIFEQNIGWPGWLVWALVLYFVVKIEHPPVGTFGVLDNKRKIIGWITIAIFILSISPVPITIK
jgi:membrane-associated protease RseP (regulator of RpoE activity)